MFDLPPPMYNEWWYHFQSFGFMVFIVFGNGTAAALLWLLQAALSMLQHLLLAATEAVDMAEQILPISGGSLTSDNTGI